MENTLQIAIAMAVYMLVVIGIGLYYNKRSNSSSDNYFLGGRSLGPWFAAMSAEASDMSGWLLMGLPGVAYWCGIADAVWTAIGLAVGTYLNWLFVARRLRSYSVTAGNSITIPEFLSNRFKENKKVILMIASVFILVFFTVYCASAFVTCGKLFSSVFSADYRLMMLIGAVFVLAYTFLGGFLAESASDFIQGIVMIIALVLIFVVGLSSAGGIGNVIDNAKNIPGFWDLFSMASPTVDASKTQLVESGTALFGTASSYGLLTILSTLSWGLGYFGMPQVLLRFMAISKPSQLKSSRRIATVWCVISLAAAIMIGVIGRYLYPTELLTSSASENVFILISTRLMPPLIAGIMLSGILAATMSSADSYMLISASALAKDIFKNVLKKNATDKQVMLVSKITLIGITIIAAVIALDENSVIFKIVSFAWAGFGATFGPAILFSLFWKRMTRSGAIAGMLTGGVTVFVWKLLLKPMGGVFGIYELLPAFILSCAAIIIASKLSRKPSKEIEAEFSEAKANA